MPFCLVSFGWWSWSDHADGQAVRASIQGESTIHGRAPTSRQVVSSLMCCMGGRRRMAAGMNWWAGGGVVGQPALQVAGCWTWARTARAAFKILYTAGGAPSAEFAANRYPRAADFVRKTFSLCFCIFLRCIFFCLRFTDKKYTPPLAVEKEICGVYSLCW